eukprot:5785191-Pyramimonas_sp.AAC.1
MQKRQLLVVRLSGACRFPAAHQTTKEESYLRGRKVATDANPGENAKTQTVCKRDGEYFCG